MRKRLAILGSTGSIGCNVLKVADRFPDRFEVVGLAAGHNITLLREQIERYRPALVAVHAEVRGDLVQSLPPGWDERVVCGQEGNVAVATLPAADIVVSAIVGAAGLLPTLAAIRAGKDIGLANKETLVMAGNLVMEEVRRRRVRLLPIDSEHSAVTQALEAGRREDVARIILTASGGPFLELAGAELARATPAMALNHPNWRMGRKISIDSASLMNKGLEVIEARWLFNVDFDKIEVLIHPQSIVHSLVEFVDGSVVAQMGIADMRIPILYALSSPERLTTGLARLDLCRCGPLTFREPDTGRFPALALAYLAGRRGGTAPAVLNAANEVAVQAFLDRTIAFPAIAAVVAETLEQVPWRLDGDVTAILAADQEARRQAALVVARRAAGSDR